MPTLVLLRHGESVWNRENRFTGWEDVDLSDAGEREAVAAGRLLADEPGLDLRVVHTSVLLRAIRTADLALREAGRSWLPVRRSWRLNERHYGALTGLDKKETAERFGSEQVRIWRRSYDVPPPPLPESDPRRVDADPRYRDVPPACVPASECLKDVVARTAPYYVGAILPDLLEEGARGGAVLVAGHGNSIRALRMHLE
ncbi:MAG TPA: 2,3-bisphosphoglycerate-dependent phosphoglycerate mutase, partial [Acidimicrobiales bacterium]|nr:2,3-bisphosphoglycerate-dependent phosphoglycerate mutase [Acidimicrobiales bacterium]